MMDFAALKESLGGLTKTVFFCGADSKDSTPIFYVADTKAKAQIANLFRTKAMTESTYANIKIKTTKSLGLENTKSLEEILSRVPHQEIIIDPSATIERATVLVTMAKQARETFGSILKACYFNSERRNIHFLFQATATQQTIDLVAMRELIEPILLTNTKRLSKPFSCGITLSFQAPHGSVIAIDQASVVKKKVSSMIKSMLNKLKLPLLVASASSMGVAAGAQAANTSNTMQSTQTMQSSQTSSTTTTKHSIKHHSKHHAKHHHHRHHVVAPAPVVMEEHPAAVTMEAPAPAPVEMRPMEAPTLPAVAYVNGWVGGSFGGLHNENQGGILSLGEAGVAFPLGHSFGGQVDGFDGVAAHNNLQAVDGFLFWRNPSQGLIGLHGKYENSDHVSENFYGLRGDAYINDWTVTLEGGGLHTNTEGGTYYAEALVHWYTNPDWRLDAGYIRIDHSNAFQIGTEYQLGLSSLPGLSAFADAGAGSHDLRYGFIGLRYYFGCSKSLERRQREDMVSPSLDLVAFSQSTNVMRPRFVS